MDNETEPRDLALHEAFVTWLAEPLDEFYTGQLVKAYANASTNARELIDRAVVSLAQPARAEALRRMFVACARDHRRMFRIELEVALDENHPNAENCGNTCDISRAMEHKLVAWAAHLLTGATECEATTEAYVKYRQTFLEPGEFEAHLEEERRELCAIPHATCGKCNAVIWEFDKRHGDRCGSCGHEIPAEEVDDDDAAD